jgi:hypothetical protein
MRPSTRLGDSCPGCRSRAASATRPRSRRRTRVGPCRASLDVGQYPALRRAAPTRIGDRDTGDWPALACALRPSGPVWTEDADFCGIGVATRTASRVRLDLSSDEPNPARRIKETSRTMRAPGPAAGPPRHSNERKKARFREPGLKAPPKEETEEPGLASGQWCQGDNRYGSTSSASLGSGSNAGASMFPGRDRVPKRVFTLVFGLATPAR